MKVSFKGAYLLTFPNAEIRKKVSDSFDKKQFTELKNSDKSTEEMQYDPLLIRYNDKSILILNGNDAKDFRKMSDFNAYCDLEKSSTINDNIFKAFLANSYVQKANIIDFSDVSETNLLV